MVGKQDKFSQLEQVKWMIEHIEYYMSDAYSTSEECKKILTDMETYGDNLYTYPTEAIRTYQSFIEHFNNNPYEYISGYKNKDNQNLIFAERLDAYFLPWENGQLVPAAMLAKAIPDEKMYEKYRIFLEEQLESYKKTWLNSLVKEVQSVETRLVQLVDVWSNCKVIAKTNNVQGLLSIIVMWFLFLKILGPKIQLELVLNQSLARGLLSGISIICVISSVVWLIGIYNHKRLKHANNKKQLMKEFLKFFEHFIRQQCNPYNIKYMISAENYMLPESNIVWNDYYEVKNYVDAIGDKRKKKLLLVTDKVLHAYITIIVLLGCVWLGLGIHFEVEQDNVSNEQAMEVLDTVVEESQEQDTVNIFDENGFVFPDSDKRILSKEEVMALKDCEEYDFKTLLGYARNEIYARKGYPFAEGGKYYTYYMQYEWYQNIEHGEVNDSMINSYERANIDLIVGIEKEEGYR